MPEAPMAEEPTTEEEENHGESGRTAEVGSFRNGKSFEEHPEESLTPEERVRFVESRYLGSKENLDRFAEECTRFVRPVVRGMMSGKNSLADDYEDVAQQVVINATFDLKSFNGDSKLTTWVTRIAVNKVNDFLRKQHAGMRDVSRTDFFEDMLVNGEETLPSNALTPEQTAIRENEASMLYAALQGLDKGKKNLIELYYLKEYSIKEIAAMLGSNENTVKVRLLRARQEMLQYLEQHGIRRK